MTSSVDTNSPSLQLFLSQAEDQAPDQSALSGGLPAAQALAFTPKLDLPPKSSVGAFPALSASPNSLKGAGWGLVVPQDPALRKLLLESIQPLLELRAQQMQYASVEQLLAERVYVADPNPLLSETAAKDWFRRVYQEQDKPYDPNKGYKRPPDYLLVLGDLHQVADSIVRVLMQSGCLVGRLAFSDEEGTPQKDLYRRYAEKVRNAEDPQRLLKRGSSSAGVYGVDDGSIATELGWSQMVQPMIQRARQVDDVFHIKNLNKEDAAKLTSREQLWDIAEALPASVLFTMSHGFGGPPGGWENPRYQRRRQGAMSFLNSAQRLTAEAAKSVQRPFLPNGIWFMFACYGAGTPAQSHFYHWLKAMPPEMFGPKGVDWVERALPQQGGDYRPFIAALPQHLLAKEDGPLAFVGHLDLAWSYGFQTARGGSDPAPFVSVLRSLVNGNRLGVAFDSLTQKRLSADGSLLVGYNRIQAQQQRGLPSDWTSADELKRQEAWMTRQDLSGYIILGDPAARLPLKVTWTDADDDEDEGPAVDLSSKSGGQSASPVTVQVPPAMPAVPPVPVSPAVSVTIVTPESASTSAKSAPTASPTFSAPVERQDSAPPQKVESQASGVVASAKPTTLPFWMIEELMAHLIIGELGPAALARKYGLQKPEVEHLGALYRAAGRAAISASISGRSVDRADEPLPPEAMADLELDHQDNNQPEEEARFPSAFAELATQPTALGRVAVANAEKFLKIPLRENAGVNQDADGYIRSFFVDGLKWDAELWDNWIQNHPHSVVIKPEWCAAFAGYCVRKAYDAAGKKLPARLAASASDLRDRFSAVGRFLPREELFLDDGTIREGAKRMPGTGDLVVFQGHVGLLRELYNDGAFVTIEGNTYKSLPRQDGVYQVNRSAAQKKSDGTFKVVGFCLLPSVDGR